MNNKNDENERNLLLKERVIRETFFDNFLDEEIDIEDYQKDSKKFYITIFKQQYLEIRWVITKENTDLYKLNICWGSGRKGSEIFLKISNKTNNENENKLRTSEKNINSSEETIITKFSKNYIEISKIYSTNNDNYNFEIYLIQLIYLLSCQTRLIELNNMLSKMENRKYEIDNLYNAIVNFYWNKINRKIIYPLSKYHNYYEEVFEYIDLKNQANSLLNRTKNISDQNNKNNKDINKKNLRITNISLILLVLTNLTIIIMTILILGKDKVL